MLIKAITGALIIILVRYVMLAAMMEKAPENQVRYPKIIYRNNMCSIFLDYYGIICNYKC